MSSFRSKRLRVQLPCGEPTLIEPPDVPQPAADVSDPPCDWMHGSAPPCAHNTCFDLPCHAQFATPCVGPSGPVDPTTMNCPAGFLTPDLHCPHGVISLPTCADSRLQPGCLAGLSCMLDHTRDCTNINTCADSDCLGPFSILITVVDDAPGTIAVAPEALPLLREQLQARLRQIEQAELSKSSIEERLKEIERAEQQLAELDGDDDGER